MAEGMTEGKGRDRSKRPFEASHLRLQSMISSGGRLPNAADPGRATQFFKHVVANGNPTRKRGIHAVPRLRVGLPRVPKLNDLPWLIPPGRHLRASN